MESEKIIEGLKENILYQIGCYQEGEGELSDIIDACNALTYFNENQGIRTKRIENNPREKAFHEQWLIENDPRPGVNFGHGILQDLFIESTGFGLMDGREVVEYISQRDRKIVATVIQWLGSNVGMCFLETALQKFGATIKYNPSTP